MFSFLNSQPSWRHKSLILSIQAAAAAFSALEARNPQLMQQSIEIYGAAVSQHTHSISGLISRTGVDPLNISTSMMLASFESLSTPATFRAYKSHLDGVSEMFLLSTDIIQQDDLLNQLFFDAIALTVSTILLWLCCFNLMILCSSSYHLFLLKNLSSRRIYSPKYHILEENYQCWRVLSESPPT